MSAGVDSEFPFTMVVDDPSGNSFVENPSAPNRDPALTVRAGGKEGGYLAAVDGLADTIFLHGCFFCVFVVDKTHVV